MAMNTEWPPNWPHTYGTYPWGVTTHRPEFCPHCGKRLWSYGDPPTQTTAFKLDYTVPAMRADEV